MNTITRYFAGSEEPEVIRLEFPDSPSRGTKRGAMKNPRDAWIRLAKDEAKALGIEFEAKKTEDGLEVAFLKQQDASELLAAVFPKWEAALLDGMSYYVGLVFRLAAENDSDPTPHIERMAAEYGLDVEKLAALNPLTADLF